MQNAKDTFFVTLRDRLAAINPDRTMVVRGAVRPAVLVEENELIVADTKLMDAFVLRWSGSAVDRTEPLPLSTLRCEIWFATCGTGERSGMDRGRVLEAMGQELQAMLVPRSAMKKQFTTTPASALQTTVFWSEPRFSDAASAGDSIERSATVQVFCLKESESS